MRSADHILPERRRAMGKRVRYALGAAGAVPALGLLMPVAAGAPAAEHSPSKSGKTVSLAQQRRATCTASRKHTHASFSLHLTFWSKPVNGRTCIGTIKLTYSGSLGSKIRGSVINNNGVFCRHTVAGKNITITCRQTYARAGLSVAGAELRNGGIWAAVFDSYPF